jgi:hypothetical protein
MNNEIENELKKEIEILKQRNQDLRDYISDIVFLSSRKEGLFLNKKSLLVIIGKERMKQPF